MQFWVLVRYICYTYWLRNDKSRGWRKGRLEDNGIKMQLYLIRFCLRWGQGAVKSSKYSGLKWVPLGAFWEKGDCVAEVGPEVVHPPPVAVWWFSTISAGVCVCVWQHLPWLCGKHCETGPPTCPCLRPPACAGEWGDSTGGVCVMRHAALHCQLVLSNWRTIGESWGKNPINKGRNLKWSTPWRSALSHTFDIALGSASTCPVVRAGVNQESMCNAWRRCDAYSWPGINCDRQRVCQGFELCSASLPSSNSDHIWQ